MLRTMDPVGFGLTIRALRRRLGWTQLELADRVGCSRSLIARIERGEADRVTVRMLTRVTGALDARLTVRVLWRGEELDRLLDAEHARLVEVATHQLIAAGWQVHVEVTFQIRGERGSIDILALEPRHGAVVVIEVKSVVPDVQAMLAALDRKVRLAPAILRERNLAMGGPQAISSILVLPGDRTARRRIERHGATFDRVLPARTIQVRRWLADPAIPISGILFVSAVTATSARHRVGGSRASAERDPARSC